MITSADIALMEKSAKIFISDIKNAAVRFTHWVISKCASILESPRIQNICLFLIMTNSRAQTNCYLFFKHLYDENEIIRVPVDFANWSYEQVELMNLKCRYEPIYSGWLSVVSSIKIIRGAHVNKSPLRYVESYTPFDMENSSFENITEAFKIACESNAALAKDHIEFENNDTIVIMKWDNLYKVVRAGSTCPADSDDRVGTPLNKSKVRFLSVEYNCPSKNSFVVLKFPKCFYVQENEVFSPVFVRRLLEYQPEEFEFDLDYTLKIMDGEINSFELKSNQYLILRETDYSIEEI
jgi:hypothetical protein